MPSLIAECGCPTLIFRGEPLVLHADDCPESETQSASPENENVPADPTPTR
jgi:hypothetical protein